MPSFLKPRDVRPRNLDPLALGKLFRPATNPRLDFGDREQFGVRLRERAPGNADSVAMRRDDSGNDRLALQADHVSPLADVFFDLFITSHCENPSATDRQRLGDRVLRVEGDHLPVQ